MRLQKISRIIATSILLSLTANSAYSLEITPMHLGSGLVDSIVGDGIEISNVQYTGATNASGYFSGMNDFGAGNSLGTGIILTTGNVSIASNTSNTKGGATGNNHLSGNTNLDALVPNYSTYDATTLSFDFVSQGDSAYFNYIFASEEYPEYVDSSFNDVFGFFIDGENVAKLSGTDTPVTINTVNDHSNEEFYNANPQATDPYPFEYDGFTDVLTAEITGLTPGETYSIEIAIADAGDHVYDSAVMIQAGSFSDAPVAAPSGVPEPETYALLAIAACMLAFFMWKRQNQLYVYEE